MTLRNVYLAQVNYQFGRNAFLPYSVGIIQAYCQTIPIIKENYRFSELFFLRNIPELVAAKMKNPAVLGLSCYIWNWEYNKALARAVKLAHPDCLIVLGGPQVPNESEEFFSTHPYVDLLIHFAGEIPFSEILLQALERAPDYRDIKSLSIRLPDNRPLKTSPRPVNRDLDPIPSPYLTGVFDELIGDQRYDFHASQETHRGCPYACTFCDWGAANFSKVGIFPDARLEAELKWFGSKEIELLYNCDANYGILKRDLELTYKLVQTKKKYSFPKSFRAAYAKNSSDRVFEIAKSLNDADLCKGVTLSFQSTNENTLDVIKRTNIKMDDFSSLMKGYRDENIPTYSEIILGLPGETYETFVDGICNLIENGQHGSINIYPCLVLPNAELNDSDHRAEYGIKTISMRLQAAHSTVSKEDVLEYCDVIIETKDMPLEKWRRAYLFGWTIQSFHSMGLTQYLSIYLSTVAGLPFRIFYEALLAHALVRPDSLLGKQISLISGIVDKVLAGGAWDVQLPEFGNINWPPEEATFLSLVNHKKVFYTEIREFFELLVDQQGIDVDEDVLTDLLAYQSAVVVDPHAAKKININLHHRLEEFFALATAGERPALIREAAGVDVEILSEAAFDGDLVAYAKEVVWYGRKKVRYLHTNVTTSLQS